MRRGGCMVWGLGIVVLVAGLGWLIYRPSTYRYKMTVEVDTPAGPRTGSVVREVKWIPTIPLLGDSKFSFKQRGEAVAVDLPGGEVVFVLLQADGYETIRAGFGQGREFDVKKLLDEAQADHRVYDYPTLAVAQAHNLSFPAFVKFHDISDPTTIFAVDHTDLGDGAALKRITMQATAEPVTNTIHRRLPWLPKYYNKQFSGDRFQSMKNKHKGLSARITSGAFSAGQGLSPSGKGIF